MQHFLETFMKFSRPAGLYTFYLASLIFTIGLVCGSKVQELEIGAVLVPLSGVGGTYVWRRTKEKLEGKS